MNLSYVVALLLTFAALTAYLNERFLRLPTTIALMLCSLGISLVILLAGHAGFAWSWQAQALVREMDFGGVFLNGMLSFLLFAGSLQVHLGELRRHRWPVAILATAGVLISMLLVAGMMSVLFQLMYLPVPWAYCLVFGALISPTDPIAVMEMLRRANAPRSLETGIAGESLFNDGVGVVAFVACLQLLGAHGVDGPGLGRLVLQQAVGGLALGALLGWLTSRMLRTVDELRVVVFLTLALVSGGYALATVLGCSGLLAIVAAGLIIGNVARHEGMFERTRARLEEFWEMVDEVLNAVLFVLIGLTVLSLTPMPGAWLAAALAIPIVLLARWLSVGALTTILWPDPGEPFGAHSVKLLTWGGLRGGIPVALALELPSGPERELILTMTYSIVVFSVLVQGLTFPRLLRRTLPAPADGPVSDVKMDGDDLTRRVRETVETSDRGAEG